MKEEPNTPLLGTSLTRRPRRATFGNNLMIKIIIFLSCWIMLWVAILYNQALHGWAQLATHYRAKSIPRAKGVRGSIWVYDLVKNRRAAYSNRMRCVISPTGLCISCPMVFRPWHPPLCLDWSDISEEPSTDNWCGTPARFRVKKVSSVAILVNKQIYETIKKEIRLAPNQAAQVTARKLADPGR